MTGNVRRIVLVWVALLLPGSVSTAAEVFWPGAETCGDQLVALGTLRRPDLKINVVELTVERVLLGSCVATQCRFRLSDQPVGEGKQLCNLYGVGDDMPRFGVIVPTKMAADYQALGEAQLDYEAAHTTAVCVGRIVEHGAEEEAVLEVVRPMLGAHRPRERLALLLDRRSPLDPYPLPIGQEGIFFLEKGISPRSGLPCQAVTFRQPTNHEPLVREAIERRGQHPLFEGKTEILLRGPTALGQAHAVAVQEALQAHSRRVLTCRSSSGVNFETIPLSFTSWRNFRSPTFSTTFSSPTVSITFSRPTWSMTFSRPT